MECKWSLKIIFFSCLYSRFTCKFRENTANAKSVLSVLGACVKGGDEIEFVCEGEDEAEALKTLVEAVENGLGE